jgi:hypothetical protein
MIIGLWLGPVALAVACYVKDPSTRWSLVIAAAVELGFVPYYTTLACRRLRYIMALIDLDLEVWPTPPVGRWRRMARP